MTLTAVVFNYNYKRYLPDVLESLQRQTRRPDRIVVSDDASPADSLEELLAIAGRFPGVEVIRNPFNLNNIEHYRARVAEVTTDAYLLMSADDYLVDDHYCEDALAALAAHPDIVTVFGWHVPVDELGRELATREYLPSRELTRLPAGALRAELAIHNTIPAVCAVVRTSLHRHIDAYPVLNRHCGDWQQFYLFTYYGDFGRFERKVCHYRIHASNMSVGYERARDAGRLLEEGYNQLLERPELSAADRAQLRAGLGRCRIRHATLRELPGELLRNAAAWPAFVETVAERGGQRMERVRKAMLQRAVRRGS